MTSYASTSAGVYVKEIDLSQRIAAVSSSIGALVGASDRGPLNQRTLCTSTRQFLALFGKPNPRTSMMHYAALQFLDNGGRLYVTRVINEKAPTTGPEDRALTGGLYVTVDDLAAYSPIIRLTNFDDGTSNPLGIYDPFNTLGFDPQAPGINQVMFFVCAENPGLWNNNLYIRIRPSFARGVAFAPGTGMVDFNADYDDPYAFYLDVFENFTSVRQKPDESFLVSRDYRTDGHGSQLFIEEVINNQSNLIRVRNNSLAPLVKVVAEAGQFIAGATDGMSTKKVDAATLVRGWDLYRDPEQVDVNILIQGGAPTYSPRADLIGDIVSIQLHMDQIAQDRMDCIAVLDVPSDQQSVAKSIAYRRNELNLNSSYSAIYSSDLYIYDKYNDRYIYVPPSGFAAAAYARTDRIAELWFAPAGMERGVLNVEGVRTIYNQDDRDALTDNQVNAIRYIPGEGYYIWGADTLQAMASALSNVNVRRLLCFVEKSIAIAALYSVYAPNDAILWSQLEDMVERFLRPIQGGRGLYWYNVQCDDKNNTGDTIAAGDVHLDVYLDPVIPGKRIHLNAILVKTGSLSGTAGTVNFKEAVSAING